MPKTSVDISKQAIESINQWVGRRGGRGMRKHALSKLIQWFGEQPDSFKSIVTGMVDEDMTEDYANALRDIADRVHPPAVRVKREDAPAEPDSAGATHAEPPPKGKGGS